MHTELLTWHTPAEKLPDVDILVLLEMEDVDGEPVWPGYLDGDQWTLADGMPVANVLRWAEMPVGGAAGVKVPAPGEPYTPDEKARAWDILCEQVRGYEVDSARLHRLDEMAKALAATRTLGVDVSPEPQQEKP